MLIGNRQMARSDTNCDFLSGETGNFAANCQVVARFCDFQVSRLQQFRLGTEPILYFVVEPSAISLEGRTLRVFWYSRSLLAASDAPVC